MNTNDPGQYQQEMVEETSQEVANPWAPFFGELSPEFQQLTDFTGDRRGGISADQRFRHETYNLPDAYKGKSRHLEDVLDFMIREEDEFYTRDLMPWEYTDDIHVQWDVFKFNRTLADIEPEQGIPRLVTAQSEGQSASLIRRGLAFQLEHGFFTTERGKKHFMLNLQQITDAIHTTAYFGVIHALLTGKTFYKEWRKRYSTIPKRRGNVLLRARNTWAILQKDIKGLYILDARAKHDMGLQNVKPNVIVMPSRASMYAQMVPTSEVDYSKRGPGAHEALASGNMNTTFRGSKVFEAEAFDVDFSDQNVDLLSRTKMIGEYFQCDWNKKIQIFDADEDAFKTITFREAAAHALNANDKKFQHDMITRRKFGHFHHRGDSDIVKAVNKLRNDAKWKQAIEKAYQDELKPRISPDQVKKIDSLPPVLRQRADEIRKCLLAGEDGEDGEDGVDLRDVVYTLAMQNLLGEDARRLTAGGGGGFDEDEDDDGAAGGGEDESHAVKMTTENLQASAQEFLGARVKDDYNEGAAREFGLESGEYQSVVNNIKRKVTECLGKQTINRQEAVDLADLVNKAHKFEDCYKLAYAIVVNVNYHAHKSVLIFRPFSTWRMGSAIIAQGGTELGSTFHGHHDFQLSDDVVRKTILGHYTFYSKAVVKRPKHYCIEEDVHCQGYVSGSGTQFFTHDTLREAVENQTIGTDQNRHDLVAWIVDDGEDYSKPIHMSGALPMTMADYDDGKDHFSGCRAMQQMLAGMGATADYADDDSYMGGNNNLNYLCFHGAQKEVLEDGSTRVTHLNKGHWGELTYDGCMGIRTGEMVEKNAKAVLRIGEK